MKDPPKPCQYRIKSLGRKGRLTESLMLSAVIIPRRPQPLISGWIISHLIQPKQRRHYSVSKISRERKVLFIQTRKYFLLFPIMSFNRVLNILFKIPTSLNLLGTFSRSSWLTLGGFLCLFPRKGLARGWLKWKAD